jgi:DNA helicase II / ATP-dependent DNA helicase PcrA
VTETEDKSLGSFLQQVALLTSVDEDKDDDQEKGDLNDHPHGERPGVYKVVYIVGMEEDYFLRK